MVIAVLLLAVLAYLKTPLLVVSLAGNFATIYLSRSGDAGMARLTARAAFLCSTLLAVFYGGTCLLSRTAAGAQLRISLGDWGVAFFWAFMAWNDSRTLKALAKAAALPAEANTVFKVPLEDSAIRGPASAPVTIVEFSEYDSAHCATAHATLKQVEEAFGELVRFVRKYEGNSDRMSATAAATLAAGQQGRFWHMHDALFANPKALADADLERHAQALGLDVSAFNASRADSKWSTVIARDRRLSARLGIEGIPTFFVNGRRITGTQPIARFTQLIKEEVVKARQLVAAGTPAEQVYEALTAQCLEAATYTTFQAAAEAAPDLMDILAAEEGITEPPGPSAGREAFSDAEWQTLQFAPLWILKIVANLEGTQNIFKEFDAVRSVLRAAVSGQSFPKVRSVQPFQESLFLAMAESLVSPNHSSWLNPEPIKAFGEDKRSAIAGMNETRMLLEQRCTAPQAKAFKRELAFIAVAVAGARDGISEKEKNGIRGILAVLKWDDRFAAALEASPLAG